MPWRAIGLLLFVAVWMGTPARLRAEPHNYALVIGANRGGHGQPPLRYATEDARHVAAVLMELGRTGRENIELLVEPSPSAIAEALARLRARLMEHARSGESSKLFFYYSGHAQARALSLEGGELSLDSLRHSLLSLPSTLTVAVLDACQSGAFSGVKGAVPAADFSTSSVSNLNNEGVAVMASSTAAELSQESADLGASYFTHHLLTGMRGVADRDRDGQVSLDEAYAYAYQNTLSDTLRTRVGSQHATLEVSLKGHGSVPLAYPLDADALLRLPEPLEARVAVQRHGRGAVFAELEKPHGTALTLALPSGEYEVLVRRSQAAPPQSCYVSLAHKAVHELDTRGCPIVQPGVQLAAKGPSEPFERWFVELGGSRRFTRADRYTDTLTDFNFRDVGDYVLANDRGSFGPHLASGIGLSRHFSLIARIDRLQKREFERRVAAPSRPDELTSFRWNTWSLAVGVRLRLPLLKERLVPFVETDLGVGVSRSTYASSGQEDAEVALAPVLRASLGMTLHLFWRLGAILSGGYDYAAGLENELGESRNDGGAHVNFGLRLRGMKGGV